MATIFPPMVREWLRAPSDYLRDELGLTAALRGRTDRAMAGTAANSDENMVAAPASVPSDPAGRLLPCRTWCQIAAAFTELAIAI